jgi:hypothetical protein
VLDKLSDGEEQIESKPDGESTSKEPCKPEHAMRRWRYLLRLISKCGFGVTDCRLFSRRKLEVRRAPKAWIGA